jgi:hypothetical protein
MMGRRDNRRRLEEVAGRRVETVEYGLRTQTDTVFHRRRHVEQHDSLEYALACREQPFTGRRGDEQVVTRTIVTYTTEWAEVPGHDGSRWFSCSHDGTPQGRTGPPIMEGSAIRMEGPDYQRPHAYRERDMTRGEDGQRRYTCPVCGLVWQLRDADASDPQGSLF